MSLASCRICYDEFPIENLYDPCKCDGSMKYICNDCFKLTIIYQGKQCRTCHNYYSQYPRYTFKEILQSFHRIEYIIPTFLFIIIVGLIIYPKITMTIILATIISILGYLIKHIPLTVYELVWIYYKLYHNRLDHILSYYNINSSYYNNNKEKINNILQECTFVDHIVFIIIYIYCHHVTLPEVNENYQSLYIVILFIYFKILHSHIDLPVAL